MARHAPLAALVLAVCASAAAAAGDPPRSPPAAAASPAPLFGEIPVTTRAPAAVAPFKQGRLKALNFEYAAALVLLGRALALDPDFPQALAWMGRCEPGDAGLRRMERAARLAEKLSEPERLSIEALLAERRGDDERVRTLRRRLVDLAPRDWMTLFLMGVQASYDHRSQAAILYLNRAVHLRPDLAEPYVYLGYHLALQGSQDEGVAAARKLVELQPEEANAHDSLGEVLLLVGRIEEAEASFRKAAARSRDAWLSWAGVAYCRFFRKDWAAGRAALAEARKDPLSPADRLAVDLVEVWSLRAEGNGEGALKAIDAVEKAAAAAKDELRRAWAAFERGELLLTLDRPDAAREAAREALARLAKTRHEGGEANVLRRSLLVLRAEIAAAVRSPLEAEAAVRELEAELAGAPSNFELRAAVHHARGLKALAAGDARQAVASLSLCPVTQPRCRYRLSRAQLAAGEVEAAGETVRQILAHPLRDNLHRGDDPAYLWVRARLREHAATAQPPPAP